MEVGQVDLVDADGDLHAYDPDSRTLYMALLGNVDATPWVHTDDCDGGCAQGSLCCADPLAQDGLHGACYALHACRSIKDNNNVLAEPVYLLAVSVDDACPVARPSMCMIQPSDEHPLLPSCPWSLELGA